MSSTRALAIAIFLSLMSGCGTEDDIAVQQSGQEAACDCPAEDVIRSVIRPCDSPYLATCMEHSKFDPVTMRHYDTQMVGCIVRSEGANYGRLCVLACDAP